LIRKANKPAPLESLAPPSRVDKGRKPKRAGPPGDRGAHHGLLLAKERVTKLARVVKARRVGVDPVTGDQAELREGFGRQPAS